MLRRPTSLTAGAALAFFAILAVAAVMLIGLLSQRNSTALLELEERALLGRAAIVSQHLLHEEAGWHLDLPEEMAAAFSSSYGRAAFAVVDRQGNVLTGSNMSALVDLPIKGNVGPEPFTVQRFGRTWRRMSVPAVVDGRQVFIRVAENLLHPDVLLDDAAAEFLVDVAWIVLPVFLALCGAMLWMLHRVKQPLRSLASQVKQISSAAPGERLAEAAVPSELLPLVLAFNEALGRIEAAQSEQRAFVADAAHELRTPLAVLQAHLDLMRDREAAAALIRDLAVLERMVGQLLTIAALDDRSLHPDAALDLRVLTSDLAEHLTPLARISKVTLRLELPPAPVAVLAEEESLSQAIVNLVENAIGHSPEQRSVMSLCGRKVCWKYPMLALVCRNMSGSWYFAASGAPAAASPHRGKAQGWASPSCRARRRSMAGQCRLRMPHPVARASFCGCRCWFRDDWQRVRLSPHRGRRVRPEARVCTARRSSRMASPSAGFSV